jgi:hypothetical protein
MGQFNALTGPELKKFLLAKIEEELDKSDKFGNHLSHPWFQYTFEVAISTYPQNAMDAKPVVIAKGLDTKIPDEIEIEALLPGVDEEFKSSGIVDTPDKARIESNQPIPTTVKGAGDILVDKPVMPKFPAKKEK